MQSLPLQSLAWVKAQGLTSRSGLWIGPIVLAGDYNVMPTARDAGLRIDQFLLSPTVAKSLSAAGVDKFARGWDYTSDHAPVWVELAVD